MGAPSKRAKKVRVASEFDLRDLTRRLESLRVTSGAYSWSLADIQAARDAQMAGNFRLPARLAESFRTDDAMFTARRTRLSAQRQIPVKMIPANSSARALRVCDESDALYGPRGVGATTETLETINSHLADHGVAFGINLATVRLDGSRTDIEMHAWPIEWVRWDPWRRCFVTRIDTASLPPLETEWINGAWQPVGNIAAPMARFGEVEIHHGDGRWVVFQASEIDPWKEGVVLPGALTWARHAFGLRDWSKGSAAHGNAKVVGELPEGTAINSPEGADFLDLLTAIAAADMPVGIRPNGSKIDYLTNNSAAWQIFKELVAVSKSSASQIYNGHDGTLGVNGAGPGVDLVTLLGVTDSIAEGDMHTIERALFTGLIQPWTAINFGDSTLAPRREYQIPDVDQEARRKANAERRTAFYAAITTEREMGFAVDDARLAALADEYGVTVAALAPTDALQKPSIALAPTDVAKVVKVNEARAGAGLGPLTRPDGSLDPDGLLTVSAFTAKQEAVAAAAPIAPTAHALPVPKANGAPARPPAA